jgi:hypothetical protein
MKKVSSSEHGSIILVFIITLPFLIAMAIYYTSLSLTSFQVARLDQLHTEAQLAADAGADYAVEQISQDNTWAGTAGDVLLHSDSKLLTKYNVTVSGDNTAKTLAITGKTFWPANNTTPARTVRIYVDLYPVSGSTYSVISGEGGLFMSNKAKVVGGDVFVNGEINLSNSAQIGLSTNPVGVKVANMRCPNPADSTYPRVCGSGENGQPITIGNSAHIYGTVQATGQSNGTGMTNNGLIAGSVTPQALPTYDRAAQKAAISNNMTGAAASCSSNNGTLTWPANTKITGDVTIGLKCKVTVQGNIWITGNLTMSNSAQLIIADSLGSTIPKIMIDGSTGASFNQSSSLVPNASGTGPEILTFYSTAGCSPDCSSVSGTSLASSRSIPTITIGQSASAGNSIFYAYWSQVSVNNTGQIGALIGQTINISNTGTITFGTSTQTGAPTVWAVKGYRRQ